MRIIEQGHEILHMDGLERIERAARTCYKSEDKIGCRQGLDKNDIESCEEGYCKGCLKCEHLSANYLIKILIKRGHEAMLEHGSATVKFITNRGVTHELVRHRLCAFGQESTRYVNYGGKEMEFIRPVWCAPSIIGIYEDSTVWAGEDDATEFFLDSLQQSESAYNDLLDNGWRPEQAREVLPNSLKTEIVVTTNYREWRHIFKLRAIGTTGKPHPQMQALMLPLLEEFKKLRPVLFEDLHI